MQTLQKILECSQILNCCFELEAWSVSAASHLLLNEFQNRMEENCTAVLRESRVRARACLHNETCRNKMEHPKPAKHE